MVEEQARKPEGEIPGMWWQWTLFILLVVGGVLAVVFMASYFSRAELEAKHGPLEYGYAPTLEELQDAGDVGEVLVVPMERYVFRTNGGSHYECDSWSGKCQPVGRQSMKGKWLIRDHGVR